MQLLGTAAHHEHAVVVSSDWHDTFTKLLRAARPTEVSESVKETIDKARDASLALFVDAHNTCYYINSYTTKVNPTMDAVMRKVTPIVHNPNTKKSCFLM